MSSDFGVVQAWKKEGRRSRFNWGFDATLVSLAVFSCAAIANRAEAAKELVPVQSIGIDAALLHPTINPQDGFIYWINAAEGRLQRSSLENALVDRSSVLLGAGARDFCLSRDGHMAFVVEAPNGYNHFRSKGGQGAIEVVDLVAMVVTGAISLPIDPYAVVCDGEGMLYVSHGSGQWGKLYKVDPRAQSILWASQWEMYERSELYLPAGDRRLYFADESSMSEVPISREMNNGRSNHVSPRNGRYGGGAFVVTADGKYKINREGNVIEFGERGAEDAVAAGTVERNSDVACDPVEARLWLLAAADGGLLTYSYPDLKLLKTDYLANSGESLSYDVTRQKLWVARSKDKSGAGGFDIYQMAAVSPAVSDYPARPHTEAVNENTKLVRRDPFNRALLGILGAMFLATLFWRWRPQPLPWLLLAIGWLVWLQALLLFGAVWKMKEPAAIEALVSGRFLGLLAPLTGGLAWGILRGSKICYVVYALILIAALSSRFCRGGVPMCGGLGLLLAMAYCGRTHWEDFN